MLEPHAPGTARAIVIAFLIIGLLLCGLLIGQWLRGGLDEATSGPAIILPGVGIGFVGADAAAVVGLHSIAELFFGVVIATLLLVSSVPLNRRDDPSFEGPSTHGVVIKGANALEASLEVPHLASRQ